MLKDAKKKLSGAPERRGVTFLETVSSQDFSAEKIGSVGDGSAASNLIIIFRKIRGSRPLKSAMTS